MRAEVLTRYKKGFPLSGFSLPMGYKESFMAHKGPHISISQDFVVNRILRINLEAFENWPESVRELAISIAEELFLIAYNPFIQPESVPYTSS